MNFRKIGEILIKGKYCGKLIEHTFKNGLGFVHTEDFEIFNGDTSDFISFNLNSIRILEFNKRGLLKVGKYCITNNPKMDNEILVMLSFKYTCSNIYCKTGELEIVNIDDKKITGKLISAIDKNDHLNITFNVPLVDMVSKIRLPIKNLDGAIFDHRLIDDDYPENDLKYNKIILQGKLNDFEFNNLIAEAEVNYKKYRFEIKVRLPETKLQQIEIDFFYYPMDEKLCIGQFELIPMPKLKSLADYQKLSKNQLYAQWEDKLIGCRHLPVDGTLNILAYAQNGIAGEFNIFIHEKNNIKSNLKGKFKLPIDIE